MARWCVAFLLLSLLPYPNLAQVLSSSNLPIIIIDTDGQSIVDEPKITAHMGIIYHGQGIRNNVSDTFNAYNGAVGIELRGNATQSFDKKPYGFETRTNEDAENNVSLLGLPPESDWILSASYLDKTFVRDPLAYEMSRRMGRWASRTIHCELILNGAYQGIYILQEKIKRDNHRVDIAKLEPIDNSGSDVTGGYIYEVAQAGPGFDKRRRFVYPKDGVITGQQVVYIKKYDDDFRSIMISSSYDDPETGYNAWIDVGSFIDEILVQEACKNSDAYGWSSYFHKDRQGKLKAGPAWDFDQALSNSTFNDGPNYSEWIIEKPASDPHLAENHPPFWMKLFKEKEFRKKVAERWSELRSNLFKTESLINYIDSTATLLDESHQRNFQRWNILGIYLWRSTPGAHTRNTYQKEVDYLKTFLINRLNWMDTELLPLITNADDPLAGDILLNNYPNPFSGHTTLTYRLASPDFVTLNVYDTFGRLVQTLVNEFQQEIDHAIPFDAKNLSPGIYFYTLQTGTGATVTRKMLIR